MQAWMREMAFLDTINVTNCIGIRRILEDLNGAWNILNRCMKHIPVKLGIIEGVRVGQKYKVILPKIQSEIQKRLLHIPTLISYQCMTSSPSTWKFFIDPTDALLTLDYPRSRSCSRLPHQTPNTLPLTFPCLFLSLPFQSLRILHPPS